MLSSKQFIPAQNCAVLGVGAPGSGKTRLGMAFPDPGIIDCDGNLRSAIDVLPKDKEFWVSQPFSTDDGKEVPEVERWNKATKDTLEMVKKPEVKTIWIDGLSNLCRWGLVHAENQLILGGINVKKEYLAKYQAFIPLLSNFITLLRIPKKYIYVTVHQLLEKDELTGAILYKLDIPGRLADNLGGQFTDVWGLTSRADPGSKVGAKYFINTKPTGFHVNLKTSVSLDPVIDITGKNPKEIWDALAPKLSVNQPPTIATPTVATPTPAPLGGSKTTSLPPPSTVPVMGAVQPKT
jgi:hypothetical protein